MENPIGYEFNDLFINCQIKANNYSNDLLKRLKITDSKKEIFATDWEPADDLSFQPDFQLQSKTRYQVFIEIKDKKQIYKKQAFFETGLMTGFNNSQWIGSSDESIHGIQAIKEINLTSKVKKARLYITGLGLYEVYIDNQKVGDEYLAPGFTNYSYYTQIATLDVTKYLKTPGTHVLKISLGDGWYKGKLGIKEHGGKENQYGSALMTNAELDLEDDIGVFRIIGTDETWKIQTSEITHSGIYYGEDLDETIIPKTLPLKVFERPSKHLKDRLSLPIKAHKIFHPKKIVTPAGNLVLDFGQNMAGWIEFENDLPKGTKVEFQYGEILQNGELYRENLRSARASFTYVSNGIKHLVRPHFTYFGFRYAKVNGLSSDYNIANFKAVALYSDMNQIGNIKTDNQLVNQLFSNIQWGQKSNFIDVPTDCPQRDERLGWTGDAAIFAKTASYNMNTAQFNKKYVYDIAVEQSQRQGEVPLYVPNVDGDDGGKAVWGDAATIIPWITYQRYKDTTILKQNFGAMMSWVDWIHDYAKKTRNEFLWLDSDQLGDWLALDTEDIFHLKGKTPDDLIASAYYYQSTLIVSKTAQVLNAKRESDYYRLLANKIRESFINEFFTTSGRLITDTQTALALCLHLNLYPKKFKKYLVNKFVARIEKDKNHLTTGFVGTPVLLPALTENNQHDLAVQIFLNEDYPGWLNEVKLGATTIWERWNSVQENGTISENGMNSLNHYSSGAVMQWAYEYLLGIQQEEQLTIAPRITPKFRELSGYTDLNTGQLAITWRIENRQGSQVSLKIDIPYDNPAKVILPNTKEWKDNGAVHQNGDILAPGHHEITYQPLVAFINTYSVHTALKNFNDKKIVNKLRELVPFWSFIELPGNFDHFKEFSLLQLSNEMKGIGFSPMTQEQIEKINAYFREYSKNKIMEKDDK